MSAALAGKTLAVPAILLEVLRRVRRTWDCDTKAGECIAAKSGSTMCGRNFEWIFMCDFGINAWVFVEESRQIFLQLLARSRDCKFYRAGLFERERES